MRIPNKSLNRFGFRQPNRLLNNSVARGLAPSVRAEDCGRSGCRGVLSQRALVSQVRGFGNFNGIIPYEIPGMPSGVLEMGLGALLGYVVGNTQGRGAVGALFGLAAGAVLGQVQPTGRSGTGTSAGAKGYAVTKQPGTTPSGATPDKAGSGFDWNAAGGIVQNLLLNSQRISDVKNIMDLVSKSWGSSTAKTASTPPAGFQPVQDSGGENAFRPEAGFVLVENTDIDYISIPADPGVGEGEWHVDDMGWDVGGEA